MSSRGAHISDYGEFFHTDNSSRILFGKGFQEICIPASFSIGSMFKYQLRVLLSVLLTMLLISNIT